MPSAPRRRRLVLSTLVVLIAGAGCAGDEPTVRDDGRAAARGAGAATAAPAPGPSGPAMVSVDTGVTVTREQFATLRWIAGKWVGREGSGPPFYERYDVLNDTTIRTETLADSTFATVNEESAIVLSGGKVMSGTRWVASSWSPTRIVFAPRSNASNGFIWEKRSDSAWTATITFIRNGQPAQRVYDMTRVP